MVQIEIIQNDDGPGLRERIAVWQQFLHNPHEEVVSIQEALFDAGARQISIHSEGRQYTPCITSSDVILPTGFTADWTICHTPPPCLSLEQRLV